MDVVAVEVKMAMTIAMNGDNIVEYGTSFNPISLPPTPQTTKRAFHHFIHSMYAPAPGCIDTESSSATR